MYRTTFALVLLLTVTAGRVEGQLPNQPAPPFPHYDPDRLNGPKIVIPDPKEQPASPPEDNGIVAVFLRLPEEAIRHPVQALVVLVGSGVLGLLLGYCQKRNLWGRLVGDPPRGAGHLADEDGHLTEEDGAVVVPHRRG
jgi:hypothetical protein